MLVKSRRYVASFGIRILASIYATSVVKIFMIRMEKLKSEFIKEVKNLKHMLN